MTQPSVEPALAEQPEVVEQWHDDPMEMMNEMLAEQSVSLHLMFDELRQYAASMFSEWPGPAKDYIRLALRAQSNCRSSLESIARADRAARRGDAGGAQ